MAPTTAPAELLLPEGTRLVHIGPPKTGTTSLQGAFHASRDALLAQGVRYAGRARHSRKAVFAVLGRSWIEAEPPPIRLWQELVAEIRSAQEPRVVLSSEGFASAVPHVIRRVVDDLDPARVHVAVTLRPLARILTSQWQQAAQAGMSAPLETWLRRALDGSRDGPSFWRRHRHDELIERWAGVVGPDRVTVVVLDEHDRAHVLRAFERLLGLREGTMVLQADLSNRSMTLPEIEAVRAFNAAFRAAGLSTRLHRQVVRTGMTNYMKRREPAPEWPRIRAPQWALDRAAEVSSEMVPRIAASGVRIIGDLATLTAGQDGGIDGDQREVSIPPEVAASMAMGVLFSSGLAINGGRRGLRVGGWLGQSLAEPPELARVSTYHLAGVLALRARNTVVRRARSLVRRAR